MPSYEEDIFDFSSILTSIDTFTEGVEQHFESVSRSLKDSFRASPWLPDSIKPTPPPPTIRIAPKIPAGYLNASREWISEYRAIIAAILAFAGTGAFIIWRRRKFDRAKRRAKKAKNGSRTEIVVLAGSPHSPLTRSLSLELERRGFIIYIPVSSLADEELIQAESKPFLRPLSLDITSLEETEAAIRKFATLINSPQFPTPKATPHTLRLSALITVPGPALPQRPITSLPPMGWSDTLNSRLLAPLTTLHAFMPLLISQKSTLLFLTPSIVPSLALPFHAAESVIAGGLQHYISTLRAEIQRQGLNIVQFRLGQFDYGLSVENDQQQLVLSQHFSVAEATRQRLEKNGLLKNSTKGTSLRELHNDVFDAIVRGKGRNGTVFVGRGSRTYDLVGKLVPRGIIGWMMGANKMEISTPSPEIAERERSPDVAWDKVGERDSDEEVYIHSTQ